MVFEFKITLLDVGAPVWRKVQIDKQASFYEFHELIQVAFGWTSSHLYDFKLSDKHGIFTDKVEISQKTAAFRQHPSDWTVYDEGEELLSDWFQKRTDYMCYTYDYGDDWQHHIEFIREIEPHEGILYPTCVAAENYAPPEDSRFDIIQGELDLIAKDNQSIVDTVNEQLKHLEPILKEEELLLNPHSNVAFHPNLDDEAMISGLLNMFDEEEIEEGLAEMLEKEFESEQQEWELTLKEAKSFLQAKPWEKMREQDIFALWDPFSRRYIFCSVLGDSKESYGVAAYYGIEGFLLLLESFSGEPFSWEDMQQQHSLLLTFEDRIDLEKDDYELIKSHQTTFRGRKSWPLFTSFQPGYAPWIMREEEITLIRLVMKETLAVIEEREQGQVLPQISQEEKILVRQIDEKETDNELFHYKSEVTLVEDLLHGEGEEELALSEIEIKRLNKQTEYLPFSIEFSMMPLYVPVQKNEGDRPFFPILVIAADTESGVIYYQEMIEANLDAYMAQKTLLDTFVQINGIPDLIITDPRTARFILPLLDVQELDIHIEEKLEVLDFILDDMYEFITGDSEET